MVNQVPPRWTLLDFKVFWVDDTASLVVMTDVPCHLYMRWSYNTPFTHKMPIFKRGDYVRTDFTICFTVYHDNEQNEVGDTLTHSFTKPNWPICETRHFYFHGTIGGIVSPSTSPPFELHHFEPFTDTLVFYAMPDMRTAYRSGSIYQDVRDDPTGIPADWAVGFLGQWFEVAFNRFWVFRPLLLFDTRPLPTDAPIISATLDFTYVVDHTDTDFAAVIQNGQPTYPHRPVLAQDYFHDNYSGNGGQLLTTAMVFNVINHIPLNPLGLSWIRDNDFTKLCLRSSRDIDSIAPVGPEDIGFTTRPSTPPPSLTVTFQVQP